MFKDPDNDNYKNDSMNKEFKKRRDSGTLFKKKKSFTTYEPEPQPNTPLISVFIGTVIVILLIFAFVFGALFMITNIDYSDEFNTRYEKDDLPPNEGFLYLDYYLVFNASYIIVDPILSEVGYYKHNLLVQSFVNHENGTITMIFYKPEITFFTSVDVESFCLEYALGLNMFNDTCSNLNYSFYLNTITVSGFFVNLEQYYVFK